MSDRHAITKGESRLPHRDELAVNILYCLLKASGQKKVYADDIAKASYKIADEMEKAR